MPQVLKAIMNALRDLLRFRIAWIIIWPILAATIFWFIVGYVFWDSFSEMLYRVLGEIDVGEWLRNFQSDWIVAGVKGLLQVILFVLLVIITTLVITTIFVMPALIKLVADRYYPDLKRESGVNITGSIVNAILATAIFILVWVVTLPLWAIGIGIIVPFIAAAFMNQQLFRYDALSEHANKQEIQAICDTNRFSLWSLGLLTGFVQFIPILNLFAPTFTALAFIHFGLAHLKLLRMENRVESHTS
ncbi:MAG: EI24 domain-containing protein [Nitrosomonas sp.]|nr:MAG: EI24 domain-containing protein [Nitrosomonas sp.]